MIILRPARFSDTIIFHIKIVAIQNLISYTGSSQLAKINENHYISLQKNMENTNCLRS